MTNSLKKQAFSSSAVDILEPRSKQIELNRRYFIVGERRMSNYLWASVIFLGGFGFLLTGISSYIKYNIFANAYQIFEGASFALSLEGSVRTAGWGGQNSLETESLAFFPQGLLMCFYGSLGVLLSLYWWLLIYWNVGGGFNEFNKKEGFMRIFRWGYPGKNRRIDLVYSLKDIEAIRVEFKQSQGFLASEQTIYVRLLSTPSVEQKIEPTSFVPSQGSSSPTTIVSGGALSSFSKSKERVSLKEKREIPLGGIGQPLTLKEMEKQASDLANYLQVALEGL